MFELYGGMRMYPGHLIDLYNCTANDCDSILDMAVRIKKNPGNFSNRCKGKILATLFYEPSTRTQMSFQSAMLRLGGSTIGFDNPMTTSVSKGENLKDTIKMVNAYADIIAMRHPYQGSAKSAAYYSDCPVINAGDGSHLHPTQTLADLTTILLEKGSLNNLTIGLCGDLKNGRTVHSLVKALCRYNTKFIFISTKELPIPRYIKNILENTASRYTEKYSLEDVINQLDVLYMTRIQRERFNSPKEYDEQKSVYVLDAEKMTAAKKDMIVLHPLPRVDEISVDIDGDPRAKYFEQAANGVYARMSLILHLLEFGAGESFSLGLPLESSARCPNTACITIKEEYIPKTYVSMSGSAYCDYCETEIVNH